MKSMIKKPLRALALVAIVAGLGLVWGVGKTNGAQAQEPATDKPVYLVAQIEIEDREGYRQYERGFGEIWARHGGEMLAVDGAPDVLEGEWSYTRTVLLRFDSRAKLDGWYRSPEYQELVKFRWQSSEAIALG